MRAVPVATALLTATAVVLGVAVVGAAEPATKRKPKNALEDINRVGNRDVTGILNLFSLRQEIELGRKFAKEVNGRIRTIDDPVIWETSIALGQNLGRTPMSRCLWKFRCCLLDETVNAFARTRASSMSTPA